MIYLSVCSRKDKQPKALELLKYWAVEGRSSHFDIIVNYDAQSIYEGHQKNINDLLLTENIQEDDVFVFIHDDVEIISNPGTVKQLLYLATRPNVGFLGVAGGCRFDGLNIQGAWWNARNTGEARGFVFQGDNPVTMNPNYFGPHGKVVVLDGCFLACSYATIKKIGLDKPHYLSSDWDFYDLHLTLKAHLLGLDNYTVPIIIRHESPGMPRPEWHVARQQFLKFHASNLPVMLNVKNTIGLPK
jgi:hypothetical protein